jgi:riboflavin kinase / FMN adenylyltransferase
MSVIREPSQLDPRSRKVCLAIGMFDGVHLGHQEVIRRAIADARQHDGVALVVTFDRHPAAVLAPERDPGLIYSLPQKLRAIEATGADVVWLIHFDEAFSRIQPEEFVRRIARDFGSICSISVGDSFKFGHERAGNVAMLNQLGEELHFNVHGLAAVALDAQTVSSTRIRQAVRAGQFDAAKQMLGRPYSLAGTVVEGDHLGATLGFPTANLDVTGLVLPPHGVYAVRAQNKGELYRAVANLGRRPTIQSSASAARVEVHLLEFNKNLYGKELEITFLGKLRDEQRFQSLDELKEQIARDITAAQPLFQFKPASTSSPPDGS